MQHHRSAFKSLLAGATAVVLGLGSVVVQASQPRLHAGSPVAVGNGTARVVVAEGSDGAPVSVSVVLSGEALNGLPDPVDQMPQEYVLPMPEGAPPTGYDHVSLDWIANGHPPAGIYTVPHFDVHFYLVSTEEQQAITYKGADAAGLLAPPEPRLLPAGYVIPPDTAVERMGVHALDPQSHEFHGKPFTQTFLYGYHAGRLIFVEPMITLAYLQSRPDVTLPVTKPAAYSLSAYYPDSYRVRYDTAHDEYHVELLGLQPYAAGPQTAQQ